MPYDDCRSYYSRSEEIKKLEPKCVKKEDKSGCELKSCYFLNSNECSEFKFENYELKICAPNDDNNGCKIKECTDIPKGNCNAFNDYFPNSQKIKCIEPEEETELNCQEENKSCEEFDHNHCENFINEGADFYFDNLRDFKRCIPKADNTSCEIKRCSELSQNDCNRFNTLDYLEHTQLCIAKKDNSGCEIKDCEEMPPNECGLITNKDFIWKCEKENDKCIVKVKECYEMPLKYCGNLHKLGKICHFSKSKNKCLSENDEENESNEKKLIKLSLFLLILNLLIY